jgi:hypothetical protein
MITIIESNKEDENGSNRYEVTVKRDDKKLAGFYAQALCECPEDATLERDLGYAYDAVEFFKIGYEAGQKREPVEYIEKEMKEWSLSPMSKIPARYGK